MGRKVLMKDIANKVGSSIALVSYVLNNKEGRVGPEMAEKIKKAAEEMGYQPNLVAKSLQSGRTNTIGLIVADISNGFFSQLARDIEDEAGKIGYTVIIGSTDENTEKSRLLTEAFLNRQVDGLIIAPAAGTEDQLKLLKKRKFPFVLVDRYFPDILTNSVRINNFESAYEATKHLLHISKGKVAMVEYADSTMSHFAEREKGYRLAMKESRCKPQLVQVPYQDMEKEMASQIKKLVRPDMLPHALLFGTHSLAIAGLKELRQINLRVPHDIALLSFDENDAFELFDPSPSFIRQPLTRMAAEAVKLLFANIRDSSRPYHQVVLEAELIIRSKEKKLKVTR
jgi:LacI family transcriptional regulator